LVFLGDLGDYFLVMIFLQQGSKCTKRSRLTKLLWGKAFDFKPQYFALLGALGGLVANRLFIL
jgi:hypothetical protein